MLAARLMRPVALGWLFAILAFAVLIGTVLLVLAGVIAGIGGVGRRGQPAPRGELRLATYRRPQHRAAITVPARPGHPGVRRLVPGISTVVYGNLTWSVLLEFIGAVTPANRWLLDTSVLFHMVLAPATSLDWISAAIISGLGMAAAAIGGVLLNQRDVLGVHSPPSPRARRTGEPGAPTC
jgi:hypothetical protein